MVHSAHASKSPTCVDISFLVIQYMILIPTRFLAKVKLCLHLSKRVMPTQHPAAPSAAYHPPVYHLSFSLLNLAWAMPTHPPSLACSTITSSNVSLVLVTGDPCMPFLHAVRAHYSRTGYRQHRESYAMPTFGMFLLAPSSLLVAAARAVGLHPCPRTW